MNGAVQRGSASQTGAGSVGVALTGNNGVFSAKNDVVLSAPDIDWSYAVIERQSPVDLTTSLMPFNLGKLVLDGDPVAESGAAAGRRSDDFLHGGYPGADDAADPLRPARR